MENFDKPETTLLNENGKLEKIEEMEKKLEEIKNLENLLEKKKTELAEYITKNQLT